VSGASSLRGTAIREIAVRVLVERGAGPIHYRDWHELLREAGYAVSGNDPQSTLLTQISRSPVVRRTTTAGVYEIDPTRPSACATRWPSSKPSCAI
jgi:hypothetical protein